MDKYNLARLTALVDIQHTMVKNLIEENARLTRQCERLEDDYEEIVSGTRPNEELLTLPQMKEHLRQSMKNSELRTECAETFVKVTVDLTDPVNADWPFEDQ